MTICIYISVNKVLGGYAVFGGIRGYIGGYKHLSKNTYNHNNGSTPKNTLANLQQQLLYSRKLIGKLIICQNQAKMLQML